MCDEDTLKDNEQYLGKAHKLSRRQFNVLTTGAALAALLPRSANAMAITQNDVTITTADGEADCLFVHPSSGKHPGVIIGNISPKSRGSIIGNMTPRAC